MKMGPNERCHCGSGRKYKRCCRSIEHLKSAEQASPRRFGEIRGIPGTLTLKDGLVDGVLNHGYLSSETHVVVRQFDPPHPVLGASASIFGQEGEYRVEFTLQPPYNEIPGTGHYDHTSSFGGGSLLRITTPEPRVAGDLVEWNFQTPLRIQDGESIEPILYVLYPNKEGFLSHIRAKVNSVSFVEATKVAYTNLAPMLSKLAFDNDVPLTIARIITIEESTGSYSAKFPQRPYKEVTVDRNKLPNDIVIARQYHPLVYYREALAATSPIYQFLCYFKVLELTRKTRAMKNQELVKQAKAEGNTPSLPAERLVADEWLTKHIDTELLSQVVGEKFNTIQDKFLNPIRVRVAHAFLDDEGPIGTSAEDLVDPSNIYRHLPLVKYIARQMVATDLDMTL